jgi:hypothetical protein
MVKQSTRESKTTYRQLPYTAVFLQTASSETSHERPLHGGRILCGMWSQLPGYAYLNGDDNFQPLPGYCLEYLETSSETCEICQLPVSKAWLYSKVCEIGISVRVKFGGFISVNKNGSGSAILAECFPFCSSPRFSEDSKGKNHFLKED